MITMTLILLTSSLFTQSIISSIIYFQNFDPFLLISVLSFQRKTGGRSTSLLVLRGHRNPWTPQYECNHSLCYLRSKFQLCSLSVVSPHKSDVRLIRGKNKQGGGTTRVGTLSSLLLINAGSISVCSETVVVRFNPREDLY